MQQLSMTCTRGRCLGQPQSDKRRKPNDVEHHALNKPSCSRHVLVEPTRPQDIGSQSITICNIIIAVKMLLQTTRHTHEMRHCLYRSNPVRNRVIHWEANIKRMSGHAHVFCLKVPGRNLSQHFRHDGPEVHLIVVASVQVSICV